MRMTYRRSVFFLAVVVFAVEPLSVSAQEEDGALRYRGITADGRTFSGVSQTDSSLANVSAGYTGETATADSANRTASDLLDDVIGGDERVWVRDTSDFPHRAIGFLNTACTGTLIGPRHVLTAAHCVYNVRTNQWYTGLTFAPARNGRSEPYGEIEWVTAYAPQGYTDDHDTHYDYALVVLKEPVGNQTGWMGFSWDSSLGQNSIHIDGYPSDKGTGTQQFESACNIDDVNAMDFTYRCSTSGGMSGSAVYHVDGSGQPVVYGVHVYSLHDQSGAAFANSATRITSNVFQQLKYWISRRP